MTEEATAVKSIHALPQRLLRQYIYRQANTFGIFNTPTGGEVVSNSPSKKKNKTKHKVLDPVLVNGMDAACPSN